MNRICELLRWFVVIWLTAAEWWEWLCGCPTNATDAHCKWCCLPSSNPQVDTDDDWWVSLLCTIVWFLRDSFSSRCAEAQIALDDGMFSNQRICCQHWTFVRLIESRRNQITLVYWWMLWLMWMIAGWLHCTLLSCTSTKLIDRSVDWRHC
jgi:hypothetical protein